MLPAIDIKHRVAGIPGTGNEHIAFSYSFDVARFISEKLLPLPRDQWEPTTIVVGDRLTWNEFLALAEDVRGKPRFALIFNAYLFYMFRLLLPLFSCTKLTPVQGQNSRLAMIASKISCPESSQSFRIMSKFTLSSPSRHFKVFTLASVFSWQMGQWISLSTSRLTVANFLTSRC